MNDRNQDWTAYFTRRLAEAEKELADFEEAIMKHDLRVWHRDIHGARNVTDESLKRLEDAVEEYRRVLRAG